ncbi:hypothetical protein [Cytobacillus praedii]|uniref:SbsC C-terminal domain-containing protein n=1 Tax=Cytobacillus praedii TaxID=1742358 RepID=A0A4R1B0G5_9BACI|nr:hypothetical protein [Cytobacillus praedii]MED3571299.1 hypothetical protein [Cytobacillus praedii]TCJ06256.1 hypothetical protein E0Y62_00155 [Cytobacillus praedii]
MKKKAIKIAASTAVAASAFVAAAPANKADAAVNVDQLVKSAEASAKVLQWSISTEGTANFVDRPYAQYNAAKKTNAAAKAAIAKLSTSEKVVYEARLLDSDIQIKRAQAYIDALTSGEKIRDKQAALDKAIKAADLKSVQSSYHVLTAEIRKQAELLYRVYGQSTRDGILKEFKAPAESLYRSVINEVTVLDHTNLVDKYTKEKNYDKATEHLAKAEEALKSVKLFKTDLTKNVNDAAAALPLDVTSIARIDSNTIQVKFTKAVDNVVATGDFVFDNGLVVTQAVLSSDKKSVTLTTNTISADKTYTLTYRGKEVAVKLVVPKNPSDPNFVVDAKDVARLELKNTRLYTVDVKDANGRTYTGDINIQLFSKDNYTGTPAAGNAFISNIDGVNQAVDTGYTAKKVNVGPDGKVVFVVTGAGTATNAVYPLITRLDDNKEIKAGGTVFHEVATTDVYAFTGANNFKANDLDYIDTTNKFVVAGSDAKKLKYDENDTFVIEGKIVSLADFAKALSDGDEFTVDYKDEKSAVSVWNITADADHNSISVDKFTKAFTVDSSLVALTGKGQPGSKIYIYESADNTFNQGADNLVSGPVTVNSNGTWTTNVSTLKRNASNQFIVLQVNSGETVASYEGLTDANDNVFYTAAINYGLFTAQVADAGASVANGIILNDANNNGLGINDTISFTFNNASFNHKFKDQTGTIVVDDTTGLKATLTVVVEDDDTLKITNISRHEKFNTASTEFVIDSAKNVTNQDGLSFKLSDKDPSGKETASNIITK